MNELMDRCRNCGRMKAADGFYFCGGTYCLNEGYDDERGDCLLEASDDRGGEPQP